MRGMDNRTPTGTRWAQGSPADENLHPRSPGAMDLARAG
jgi:hypothetical protein